MKKLYAIFFLLSFVFTSCNLFELNKPVIQTNGLTQDINSLVPQSILDQMTSLGMVINTGNTPPNLGIGSTGTFFKATPFVLKNTNITNDYAIGYTFADFYVKYYDQDNSTLKLKVDYKNGPETGTGLGGLLVGKNNTFTVFAKISATNSGTNADIIQVVSGTLTSSGIKDLYFANFMLNDYGDPKNVWMANGQGRVLYDSDGNSPIVSSFSDVQVQKVSGLSAGSSFKLF